MHKTRSAKANAYPAHSLPTECFCEPGLFTASGEMEPRQPPACTQLFQETARGSGDRKRLRRPQAAQEIASWLSLATRSKASVELLIRYWQSSPSVGSRRITS